MKNYLVALLLGGIFTSCQRPLMRSTLEPEQPQSKIMTYSVINKAATTDDLCINAAIEHKMTESGFFKSPFEGDLKVYYRYSLGSDVAKKDKRLQILVIDTPTNTCLWRGETVNLPKKITPKEIIEYTHLLMQRFEWEAERNDLLVRN